MVVSSVHGQIRRWDGQQLLDISPEAHDELMHALLAHRYKDTVSVTRVVEKSKHQKIADI